MKKKISIAIIIIVAVVLVATWVAPYIILIEDSQEKVADSYAYSEVFFDEYDEVREHLLATVDNLKNQGIETDLYSHAIDVEEDLYIDTIYLPSSTEQKNLVVLTTGVHGIEGYIGSVMLDVFWQEIYPDLNKESTGVLVIANVNSYGMKHHRRYNENNVDLNRNFIIDWESFDTTVNKDYSKVDQFLGPQKKMGNALWHEAGFYASMVKEVVANGADSISNALLGGQYEYPQGVYYGGAGDEQSTTYVKDVFEWTLGDSQYDNVISYDSESFYATTGDTTDFYYRLKEQMGAETALFSTCFEFGTIGDRFLDSIISMKYTIEENQNHWYPTTDKVMNAIVKERYQELFYPTEMEWREKTVADFAAAAKGVLNAKLITE